MNCARVIHGNQIATNGVVHVIDRVLTQIGTSIQDFLDAEDDLSSFRVRTGAGSPDSLKEKEGSFSGKICSLQKCYSTNLAKCNNIFHEITISTS